MNIYTMFIHNFMRAKAAIEIAKQARPVFAKFLEVSESIQAVACFSSVTKYWLVCPLRAAGSRQPPMCPRHGMPQ